jgi:hypothetical protein
MRAALAIAMPTLLLSLSVAACSDDKPAVCSSVDSLKSSVDAVKNINVGSSGALTDLQSGLTAIKTDLADVKSDAKSEFSWQISPVETSYFVLKKSVRCGA